jgi:hypothetical protein
MEAMKVPLPCNVRQNGDGIILINGEVGLTIQRQEMKAYNAHLNTTHLYNGNFLGNGGGHIGRREIDAIG